MATRPWPEANTIRVAFEGQTAKAVNWANIFWSGTSLAGTPTPAQCASLASTLYGIYNTHIWTLLGKDANLLRCVVNFYGGPPMQVVGDHLATTAGGSANNTEVDSLSAAISWTIPATWRGGKPRTYLAALPTEAFGDSNTLDSGFVSDVESGAAAFLTAWNGSSVAPFGALGLGCMSFFSGNAPRAAGTLFQYTASTVHPRIDSMRRRLGKERT